MEGVNPPLTTKFRKEGAIDPVRVAVAPVNVNVAPTAVVDVPLLIKFPSSVMLLAPLANVPADKVKSPLISIYLMLI